MVAVWGKVQHMSEQSVARGWCYARLCCFSRRRLILMIQTPGCTPAGHAIKVTKRNLMYEETYVDPNFFADDYTVAAATGFQVHANPEFGPQALTSLLFNPRSFERLKTRT